MKTRRHIRRGSFVIAAIAFVCTTVVVGDVTQATALKTTVTRLKSVPKNQTAGNPVELQARVGGRPAPSGTVEFFEGATSLGTAPLVKNLATLSDVLPAGTHTINAAYSGDAQYASSSSNVVTIIVGDPSPVITDLLYYSIPPAPMSTWTATTPVRFIAQVVIKPHSVNYGVRTGDATVDVDGTKYDVTVTSSRIVLIFPNGLGLGTHTAQATYHGDIHYLPDTSNRRTVTVSNP